MQTEKTRVYAPVKRQDGVDWKEFNFGINKIMQVYCGDPKSEELMNLGLELLDDLKEDGIKEIYASDPHKLGRCLEVMDVLTYAEAIIHASLARKASSAHLHFYRWDFPEVDPPDWHKFITLRMDDGQVKTGELPIDYWGSFKVNYDAHCRLGKEEI